MPNSCRHRHLAGWRLSPCQLRRLSDRPRRLGQWPAFNTAVDEKINAGRHLWATPPRPACRLCYDRNLPGQNSEQLRPLRIRTARGAFLGGVLALVSLAGMNVREAYAAENYAIAMHGVPALPADFDHMPYAKADAPKGGKMVQGVLGTFDSLN